MNAAIHLNGITKTYHTIGASLWGVKPARSISSSLQPVTALDRVSFDVEEGEIFGLYGPSGSGKTTLIRLLAARLVPDAGIARVFGYDVARQRSLVQRQSNPVSVAASFYKGLSALGNLLQAYPTVSGDPQAEITDLLLRLGLDEPSHRQPIEALNRDQQQLIFIARALLGRPRLLLLDHPTLGLDLFAQYRVREALGELRDLHGTTIVFTAHTRDETERIADRMAALCAGRLIAIETPQAESLPAGAWSPSADRCRQAMEPAKN